MRRPSLRLQPPSRQTPQSLTHIALVRDYDEAIACFTDKLGFILVADERPGPEQAVASPGHGCEHPGDVRTSSGPARQPEQDKRWVLVAPPGAGDNAATLLLARAATPEQAAFIGNQAGGRVCLLGKRPCGPANPPFATPAPASPPAV